VYFSLFRIFEQLALALINRVALEFFTVVKYILPFRIFEQLALALKIFKPGGEAAPPENNSSYPTVKSNSTVCHAFGKY